MSTPIMEGMKSIEGQILFNLGFGIWEVSNEQKSYPWKLGIEVYEFNPEVVEM